MQFQAQSDDQPFLITVMEVQSEAVTVNANHPLAGVTLSFDVKVVDVRDASAEELDHGHVHGDDHHHEDDEEDEE
jgi:FKBP-type peptidyl-prolyl cis-trans isomerase SlyD